MPPPSDSERGPERFLRVDHLTGDLRGRSVRSGAVTLTNQAAKFIATLVGIGVLARLLTPQEFGLVDMALPVIGFIAIFKDLGLAMATVQRRDISHGQVSTLFWINLGFSLVIALVTVALAPLYAALYPSEPHVMTITMILAGTIVFSGLSVQHQALLKRQMRFGALAGVELTALVASFVAAIIGAALGMGFWALLLIHYVREMATAAGVWWMCGWRPGGPVRRSGVRAMLSFGAHLTGFNIVNYFARNLDKILVGRYFGAASLGFYAKAYQLVLLPIQQINNPLTGVAVPTLSRLQDQLPRFRAYYRRGLLLVVTAGMPIVAFLFVDTTNAVLTILGTQWMESVPIFRALAPAAFLGTFNVATGWVYISLGRTKRQFNWGIFASIVTMIAFAVGLRWGAIGVGAAFSVSMFVMRAPAVLYCYHGTPLRFFDLVVAIWRPMTASIAGAALFYFLLPYLDFDAPMLLRLAVDFAVYLVVYILIWIGLPGGRGSLRDLVDIARELRPSRPS